MVTPIAAFGIWQLTENPSLMGLKDGLYNCLDKQEWKRLQISEQQGVPMLSDPRPGGAWAAKVRDDELVKVSSVDLLANKETIARSHTISERVERTRFTARIQGKRFTCYLD